VAALKQIGVLDDQGELADNPRSGFQDIAWRVGGAAGAAAPGHARCVGMRLVGQAMGKMNGCVTVHGEAPGSRCSGLPRMAASSPCCAWFAPAHDAYSRPRFYSLSSPSLCRSWTALIPPTASLPTRLTSAVRTLWQPVL
jgi:hypothetical protein